MHGKKKYIGTFGSFTEPFNYENWSAFAEVFTEIKVVGFFRDML